MGSISSLSEYEYPINFAMEFYARKFGESNIPRMYRQLSYYDTDKIVGIKTAIDGLPEDARRIIELRYESLMSFKDIAATFGKSVSSIRYTYGSSLEKLRVSTSSKVLMLHGKREHDRLIREKKILTDS